MLILNALTHLITFLLNSGRQFMHYTVLLCVQYNVKLCCSVSSWFAEEANGANNNDDEPMAWRDIKDEQEHYKCYEKLRHKCNLEGWCPRHLEHTIYASFP